MILMKLKSVISLLLVGLLTTILATSAGAAGPQWNHLKGDLELLTGRNLTKNQTTTTDPVNADSGDTIEGVIYYHNGVADQTAENVIINVNMPLATISAKSHLVSASIKADNAPLVSDTIVDGKVVGKSNLTVNVSSAARLEVLPGTVRWFKDNETNASPLPFNQNGSELFGASGLRLGNIAGCWSHAGFVMFKMRLVTDGKVVIEKSKKAWNDTLNKDATLAFARPSDQITYTLTTKNSGTSDQSNYVIEDGVGDILDYADVVSVSDSGQKVANLSDTNRDNQSLIKWLAVDIKAGQSISRSFTVKVKNPLPTNPQNGHAFDMVMFNTYGNDVVIVIEKLGVALITIQKDVLNMTRGDVAYVDANTANPGDVLSYRVIVSNNGTKSIVATLQDLLPSGVQAIAGSGIIERPSGITYPTVDSFINNTNLLLGNLSTGETVTITFGVEIMSNLSDNTDLVNKASVIFDNQTKMDTASTLIMVPKVPEVPETPSTTPTITPNPTQSTLLPPTGASPFAAMLTLVGIAYAVMNRRKLIKSTVLNSI